ncbi:MAG: DUF4197 domain-containing protein [Bacteroidia bacterium]
MTKKIIPVVALIAMSITATTAQSIQNIANGILNGNSGSNGSSSKPLSNDEVVRGLKDALTIGTNNSTGLASKVDGYYKNPKLFIPFPKEAKDVKDKLDAIGMKKQTDKFVMSLNRAAEEAAKSAAPIFVSAVKGMTITDGFTILKGGDNAATTYLQNKTTAQLKQQFTPIVKAALDKVEVTKYWNPLIKKYNKLPMVKKQNPDLTAYVTDRAIAGLFVLIAEEELKIRKNPAARVTDILQKVFGSIF